MKKVCRMKLEERQQMKERKDHESGRVSGEGRNDGGRRVKEKSKGR